MVGIELVADRATRAPFPRAARVTEAVVRGGARARACSSTRGRGTADGTNGDSILLGPPFVITDEELVRVADGLADAIDEAVAPVERTGLTVGAGPAAEPRPARPLARRRRRRRDQEHRRRRRSAGTGRPSRRTSGLRRSSTPPISDEQAAEPELPAPAAAAAARGPRR